VRPNVPLSKICLSATWPIYLIDIAGNYVNTKTSFELLRGCYGMGWRLIATHWLAPDYPAMVLDFGFFLFRPCFIVRHDS
jgi:hypothetical protein